MNSESATATNSNAPDLLPSTWPGAFGIYKYSKQAVRRNIWLLIELWLLFAIPGEAILLATMSRTPGHYSTTSVLGNLLVQVIGALATLIMYRVLIAGVRGKKTTFNSAFSDPLLMPCLKLIVLNIIVGLIGVFSLTLFVIPFFFIVPRLLLATYFLVDQDMDPFAAVKASWAATKGNTGKVWGILGATLAMALLVITIIGIPFAIYFVIMYSAAYAVLYEYLLKQQGPSSASPQATPLPTNTPVVPDAPIA